MIPILAAGVLSPFFFEATPEVRSTYQSLGKIVGGDERRAVGKSRYRCAHGDWTHFGIGIRFRL